MPMRSRRPSLLIVQIIGALVAPAALVGACHHGGGAGSGPGGGAGEGCDDETAVESLLTTRCAGSSCHGSGPSAVFPPLALGDPGAWVSLASHEMPGVQLVVPGHPEQSYLYMKVSGKQGPGGGALMPLGASTPIAEASVIHDWIAAGAPASCAGDAGPPGTTTTDPNTLDQSQLFTCPAHAPAASSPARIRRIDSPEWTYSIPQARNGWHGGNTTSGYLNPFTVPATQPYSTYAVGATIDTATLDLYFQVLPEAPLSWVAHDPANHGGGLRIQGVNDDGMLDCMFGDSNVVQASPSDTCIDTFVERFLTYGVLARAPTQAETANLKALLVSALAAEGGDVMKRQATLAFVGQAAWLTSGALFRSELGEPVPHDPAKRSRLSNEELALAVGGMLSFHRPGAPMLGLPFNGFVGPSDPDDVCDPWLHLVSDAATDGSIQDPATIKKLVAAYGGGVDPGGAPLPCTSGGTTVPRRDLSIEGDSRRLAVRGEYWLAPRIADFFRQWLAYGAANTIFKDTPGLTSRFATSSDPFDPTTVSFANLQSTYYGYESSLQDQLDDTVARTVIDATNDKVDVFKALLTTRIFRLPSDRVDTSGVACTKDADCTSSTYGSCDATVGLCVDSIATATVTDARVYDVEGVPATNAARWVTMPAGERSGVLTHPAWLAAHGENFQDDPSLIRRGKWVRENLFCETVPGLELVMVQAMLGARAANLSARDRVEAAIDPDPTCKGCHMLMNPLGYPFEMYNHAGFLRAYDKLTSDAGPDADVDAGAPHPPDATSTIDNAPDPALDVAVMNAIDFTHAIAGSPYARRCFIRQAFRYFMGRDETMADQCTLAAMEAALDGGSFFDMLGVLASSDTVLYRSTGGAP